MHSRRAFSLWGGEPTNNKRMIDCRSVTSLLNWACLVVIFMMTSSNGSIFHVTGPLCRPFVRGIHRSQVNSPKKGQWRGALIFSFICAWINARVNNREAGDLRHHRAHYDNIVMYMCAIHLIFTNPIWVVMLVADGLTSSTLCLLMA